MGIPLGERADDRAANASRAVDLRSREVVGGTLFTDDGGRFAFYSSGRQCGSESLTIGDPSPLGTLAGRYLAARRRHAPAEMDYLILVPTLRCNLACSYCQVSRASIRASGHDWTEATLERVIDIVAGISSSAVKIEFQGGEPTLRPDLINRVIDAVPASVEAQFVICTNLEIITDDVLAIFDREEVAISTSLDGILETHAKQRGNDTAKFAKNLADLVERYGPDKISALPTINPDSPPAPSELVESFLRFGMHSVYLRPINYQGFARKNHSASHEIGEIWSSYHRKFIEHLVERNWDDRARVVEESYFSLILRRIFRPGSNRHVDLRNPNPMGRDYVVIDHDGTVYPTDEARMLTRTGLIDLSIGDVIDGWDTPERDALDQAATLDGDPDCEACVYKPYCGRDIIDDISRYGTIDIRRTNTEFCRRHLALFDLAFEMICSKDEKTRYSIGRWLDLPGPAPLLEPVQ